MEQENKNKSNTPKKHRFIAPLLAVALGAAAAGLTGCPSPVGGGGNGGEEQEHGQDYVFDREETRYENTVYFDPKLSGKEVRADEAWVRTGADKAQRFGKRTVIVDRIGVRAVDGAEKVLSTNTITGVSFNESTNLLPGYDVKDGKIVDEHGNPIENNEVFPDWNDASVVKTTGQVKNGEDIDFAMVNSDDTAVNIDLSLKYTYTIETRTGDKGTKQTRYVFEKSEPTQEQDVGLSGRDPVAPVAINTADQVGMSNTAGSGVGDGMTDVMAVSALEILLPKFSMQAAALQDFFADSAIDSSGNDIFDQLENAENGIRTAWKSGNTLKLQNYLDDVVNPKESAALLVIGAKLTGDSLAEFNTLWKGYKEGHYIITRDWNTEGGANAVDQTKLNDYREAYKSVYDNYPSGSYYNNRGVNIANMGANPVDALKGIQEELVGLGVTALQGYNVSGDMLDDMLRALIIQLGQDHEELRAFCDDLEAAGLTPAKNRDYTVTPADIEISQLVAAPIGQQSVKLAALDTTFPLDAVKSAHGKEFDLDAVKSAYGKEFDTYTGAFTPYKKNEDRMA